MSARIPTWQERLKACFQWRHRLMHVVGVPTALGALTAAVGADWINATSGMGLGALVAGVGTLLAGYYVVAGFDQKLVENLQAEEAQANSEERTLQIEQTLQTAPHELRPTLARIVSNYNAVEATFTDGIDDQVEAILDGSRDDLLALRDRAVSLVSLYNKLGHLIRQANAGALTTELERVNLQLAQGAQGGVKDALLAAKESTEKALERHQAAINKQQQVRSVLTVIETSLQEFKMAMELRKADAALSESRAAPDVSELQSRLQAAGQACDELVGGVRRRRQARESA